MSQPKQPSRRHFLQQVAGASAALALAGSWTNTLWAAPPFASDKKFVPVMITPYKKDKSIDFDALSRLTDFYRIAGAKGYFANCLSSEMYALQPAERLALATHVVKRAQKGLSVVATGSFGDTQDDRVAFTKKMYDTGVNAVIIITSHFAKKEESDQVWMANIQDFLNKTGNIPLGTYECPSPYKRILTPETFSFLLSTNRFIYHKDTTIDFEKVKAKILLVKQNPLEFYDACVANTMNSIQAGAKGMSAISGNLYPEILVWMCNYANDPSRQEDVRWLQGELNKTEDILGQNYPLSAKYFMNKRGVKMELISRVNDKPLSNAQIENLNGVYKTFLGWCDRIGIKPAKL